MSSGPAGWGVRMFARFTWPAGGVPRIIGVGPPRRLLCDGHCMTAMKRYHWDSPEYAEAFATLLRSYGSREHLYRMLRDLLRGIPSDGLAIDWGAGTGDLTR